MTAFEVTRLMAAGLWSAIEYKRGAMVPLEEVVDMLISTPIEMSQLKLGAELMFELGLRVHPEVIANEPG